MKAQSTELTKGEQSLVAFLFGHGWNTTEICDGTRLAPAAVDQEVRELASKQGHRKFKLGDVVQLTSGGVLMTVVNADCCGPVEVAIGVISGGAIIYESFPEACLMPGVNRDDDIPF